MKIIIAGGRDYLPTRLHALQIAYRLGLLGCTEVVSGRAKGADRFGEQIADLLGLPTVGFPADWDKHGRGAGPIRNKEMADYADALIVLPGGKGTANMISQAVAKGIPIYQIGSPVSTPSR